MKIHTALALAAVAVALWPAAGAAEDSDQSACMQDALSICSQFIPNREQVANCLMTNRSRVSPACRGALKHFVPHTASAS